MVQNRFDPDDNEVSSLTFNDLLRLIYTPYLLYIRGHLWSKSVLLKWSTITPFKHNRYHQKQHTTSPFINRTVFWPAPESPDQGSTDGQPSVLSLNFSVRAALIYAVWYSNNNVTRTFYYKTLHLARWRVVMSNKLWVIQYFPSLSGRTKPAWVALSTLSYNVFSNSYKNDITSHSSAPRVVSQT